MKKQKTCRTWTVSCFLSWCLTPCVRHVTVTDVHPVCCLLSVNTDVNINNEHNKITSTEYQCSDETSQFYLTKPNYWFHSVWRWSVPRSSVSSALFHLWLFYSGLHEETHKRLESKIQLKSLEIMNNWRSKILKYKPTHWSQSRNSNIDWL